MKTVTAALFVLAALAGLAALLVDPEEWASCGDDLAGCAGDCAGGLWCGFKCVMANAWCLLKAV